MWLVSVLGLRLCKWGSGCEGLSTLVWRLRNKYTSGVLLYFRKAGCGRLGYLLWRCVGSAEEGGE
jgi:hypothetical protein